jgi:hypothetical protein
MATLPPPPSQSPPGSTVWIEWYRQLRDFLVAEGGTIPWNSVDKTGANLTDLPTRTHNSLQSLQGGTTGEYYHLTSAQATDLTDSGLTTLHNHSIRPKYFAPAVLTVTTGTLSAGTVANLAARGGTTVVITEVIGVPGFNVEVAWTGVAGPIGFVIEGWYQGTTSHNVDIEAWNYTTSAWDKYDTAVTNTVRQRYNHMYMLSSDYVSAASAKIRFYHTTTGVGTHTLNLDYCALVGMETY